MSGLKADAGTDASLDQKVRRGSFWLAGNSIVMRISNVAVMAVDVLDGKVRVAHRRQQDLSKGAFEATAPMHELMSERHADRTRPLSCVLSPGWPGEPRHRSTWRPAGPLWRGCRTRTGPPRQSRSPA